MSQIVFPNSPGDEAIFLAANGTTYQYDSATGQWKIQSTSATAYTPPASSNGFGTRYVSTGDPTGGVDGDMWIKVEA